MGVGYLSPFSILYRIFKQELETLYIIIHEQTSTIIKHEVLLFEVDYDHDLLLSAVTV